MSVPFNVVQKPEPGVPGGGEKKWYASATNSGDTDINELIRKIEKISTMSGGDIKGVVYTLVDVIRDELQDGKIVRLGDLGDFRISLSSEGHENEEDVSAASIKSARVLFRPRNMIRSMLNNLTFVKNGQG